MNIYQGIIPTNNYSHTDLNISPGLISRSRHILFEFLIFSLSLTGNQISDIGALSGLVNLEELDLSENKISDINALKGLYNLTELWLGENPLTDAQIAELQTALPNCDIYFQ